MGTSFITSFIYSTPNTIWRHNPTMAKYPKIESPLYAFSNYACIIFLHPRILLMFWVELDSFWLWWTRYLHLQPMQNVITTKMDLSRQLNVSSELLLTFKPNCNRRFKINKQFTWNGIRYSWIQSYTPKNKRWSRRMARNRHCAANRNTSMPEWQKCWILG